MPLFSIVKHLHRYPSARSDIVRATLRTVWLMLRRRVGRRAALLLPSQPWMAQLTQRLVDAVSLGDGRPGLSVWTIAWGQNRGMSESQAKWILTAFLTCSPCPLPPLSRHRHSHLSKPLPGSAGIPASVPGARSAPHPCTQDAVRHRSRAAAAGRTHRCGPVLSRERPHLLRGDL
jgi:hypothetical protein